MMHTVGSETPGASFWRARGPVYPATDGAAATDLEYDRLVLARMCEVHAAVTEEGYRFNNVFRTSTITG